MKLLYFIILLFLYVPAKAAKQIEFATHYDYPPFVIDMKRQQGFVFDLAKYLSKQSNGLYEFQVTYVPRVRIENYLNKKNTIVVPFVSPKWFNDENLKRYLWTGVLMTDQNVVVTHAKSSIDYKNADSITGKTMAYLLGHKIPAVDGLISEGKVLREESPSMIGNFKKIVEGRADFLVTGETVVRYIIKQEHWEDQLRISSEPVDVFERRILVSPSSEVALHQWLNNEVENLLKSSQWPVLLSRYKAEDAFPSQLRKPRQQAPVKTH